MMNTDFFLFCQTVCLSVCLSPVVWYGLFVFSALLVWGLFADFSIPAHGLVPSREMRKIYCFSGEPFSLQNIYGVRRGRHYYPVRVAEELRASESKLQCTTQARVLAQNRHRHTIHTGVWCVERSTTRTVLTRSESQPPHSSSAGSLPPQHDFIDTLVLLVDILSGGNRATSGYRHALGNVFEEGSVSTRPFRLPCRRR